MDRHARVESVTHLKDFRNQLVKFADAVQVALGNSDAHIQRMKQWLSEQQKPYWNARIKKLKKQLREATVQLNRKKLYKSPTGGKQSYLEEQRAVDTLRDRLEEAETKRENVRTWLRKLDREIYTYRGKIKNLESAFQTDFPKSLSFLDRALASLESYMALSPPVHEVTGPGVPDRETTNAAGGRPAPASGTPLCDYAALRRASPDRETRLALEVSRYRAAWLGGTAFTWDEGEPVDADELAIPDPRRLFAHPAEPGDKVIIAHGAREADRIYLERSVEPPEGDSGWYIGAVGDDSATAFDVVTLAGLTAARPDMTPLLRLPEGSLVVIDHGSLQAVLDENDRCLWPPDNGTDEE